MKLRTRLVTILTLACMVLLGSAADGQTFYRSAKSWTLFKPTESGRTLLAGPIGSSSPLWLGTAPSGTATDAWLYMTGQPSGFEYSLYSGSTLPSYFAGDLTIAAEGTGGNLGAKNELSGLPRLKLYSMGTGTNGSTETTSYLDDSPAGEWTAVDSDVTVSASTTYARVGSTSLALAFASTAAAADGAYIDITNDDLESNESIGFWIYSDTALTAGWLTLVIDDTDASPDLAINFPAVTANAWQWVEIDISALTGGNGNVTDKIKVLLSTAGATGLGAFNVYLDGMYKWDASDEEALGDSIITDGVLSVVAIATAAGSANTASNLVAGTDFFVHYQAGSDAIVWITDQSAASTLCLYSY